MPYLRRTVSVFIAALLVTCTMASAAPEPNRQAGANKEEPRTDLEQRYDSPFLAALRNLTPATAFSSTTSEYCTRAIDPFGVACYVACPEGCSCSDFGFMYMQCCCDLAM